MSAHRASWEGWQFIAIPNYTECHAMPEEMWTKRSDNEEFDQWCAMMGLENLNGLHPELENDRGTSLIYNHDRPNGTAICITSEGFNSLRQFLLEGFHLIRLSEPTEFEGIVSEFESKTLPKGTLLPPGTLEAHMQLDEGEIFRSGGFQYEYVMCTKLDGGLLLNTEVNGNACTIHSTDLEGLETKVEALGRAMMEFVKSVAEGCTDGLVIVAYQL